MIRLFKAAVLATIFLFNQSFANGDTDAATTSNTYVHKDEVPSVQDWRDEDTRRQLWVNALFVLDYLQTRSIQDCYPKCYETNPILGRNPSTNKVRGYFITAAVLHTALAYYLTPEYRKAFQEGTIALELIVIGNNKRIGLGMKW